MFEFITQTDFAILDFIQNFLKNPFFDKVMPMLSKMADEGIFWIGLAIFFLFDKSTRKTAWKMGLAMALGLAIGNGIIKNVVCRVRPYDINTSVQLLIPKLTDWSFPSGHTLSSFEAAGVLMICDRKRFGIPALVLSVLIAFSRMYLYVHYPTDVLGGAVLGIIFAIVGCVVVDLIYKLIFRKSRKSL